MEVAKRFYIKVIELDENFAHAHQHLGYIECMQGLWDEGLARIRCACDLDPTNTVFWSLRLWLMTACPSLTEREIATEHSAFGAKFLKGSQNPEIQQQIEAGARLRVGYLSAAFNHHVCMDFFLPLLANHSKTETEIFCYSASAKVDDVTGAIKTLADYWRDVSYLSDSKAANLIALDNLDVLVDLDGHAGNNRIGILCEKPAPVIVNWLGYPNTTGLAAIDYRLVDTVTDPEEISDLYASETLVRLPNCFLIYKPLDDQFCAAEPPSVDKGYCAFGCFNHPAKLNDDVFRVWSLILSRSPGSVLVLKNRLLTCEDTRSRIQTKFTQLGIARERVVFLPYEEAQVDHLLHYHHIDIALDPFPYNGTTTTCEALWMGVPVITRTGDRHASRVGTSLLGTIGAPELIGSSEEEYVNLAVDLAENKVRLQSYRRTLRDQMKMSPLGDYKAFAGNMESVLKGFVAQRSP